MNRNGNAAGAPTPTASNKLLSSSPIVPPAATGDQGPRDMSLVSSTAYSDPDDTEATILLGVDYSPAQLDEIAEHTRCAVLSTPATAEEVAAGAVPKLGLTLADFDDFTLVSMDSPRLTENAADRIAAVIADQAGGRLTRPEVRETITTAHLHRGTDVHLTVSSGRAVEDINGHRVIGPERSTSSTTTSARPSAPAAPPVVRHSGQWLDDQEFAALRWVVPEVVPEGYSLVVGPPKVGKSRAALGIGLSSARDNAMMFGCIDSGPARPTLYLALEDGHRRMQDRARAILGRGVPIPDAFHYVLEGTPEALLDDAAKFVAEHSGESPVVLVDTVQKARPSSRNSRANAYEADYAFGSILKSIVDPHPGSGLIGVHHTNKGARSGDFVDTVSGSHGFAGAADSVLILSRERGEDAGLLQVTGRDVSEETYALVSDVTGWRLDGPNLVAAAARAREERLETKLSGPSRAVVDAAKTMAGEFTAKDIADITGLDAKKAGQTLNNLVNAKSPVIFKASRGKFQYVGGVAVSVGDMFGV